MNNATFGQSEPLLSELKEMFQKAQQIDMIVSFMKMSGLQLLKPSISAAVERGVPIRILTSTYMNITDPTALLLISDLVGENGEIRLYNGSSDSFHPKSYIFHGEGTDAVFVGSSNISATALTDGVEWNYRIRKTEDSGSFQVFAERFEYLFQQEAIELTEDILRDYRNTYVRTSRAESNINQHFNKYKRMRYPEAKPELTKIANRNETSTPSIYSPISAITPNDAQQEALIELKRTRVLGYNKALVVAATGVGKTYLAAFDAKNYSRILFVAHREEILTQAYETFMRVRGGEGFGRLYNGQFDYDSPILFASIQTLMRNEHLMRFSATAFDYIIYDDAVILGLN